MKTSFTKKQLSLAVTCALVLGFASGAARAQSLLPASERELWTENSSKQVWRSANGECWHSVYGPPPPAGECNPAVAQYVAPAPAPARTVAPALAPAPYIAPVQFQPAPVVVPPQRPRKPDRN